VAKKEKGRRSWDGDAVRSLRLHLGLSQDKLADELGTRQQTISEWETDRYRPRGASSRLLSIVAERAGFEYGSVETEQLPVNSEKVAQEPAEE
jgi:DNA-binding transcriptional regulator YiaG